jgi:MFS family permease
VVELSPPDHQGLAMALFSQCFAVSSLGAPLLAGALLDSQGHGAGLWLLMAALVLLGLPLVRQLAAYQRRNVIQALSRADGDGGQEILYRFDSDRSDKPDRSGTLRSGSGRAGGLRGGDGRGGSFPSPGLVGQGLGAVFPVVVVGVVADLLVHLLLRLEIVGMVGGGGHRAGNRSCPILTGPGPPGGYPDDRHNR